ncbi:MAG: L-threonylcarbamoyladenylate synthase [Enterococcus sp.]
METKKYQEIEIAQAAQRLREGELIAFPSETVYGLGANALLPEAVQQVFTVKGRPSDNPVIVHVADFEQVKAYVSEFHPLTEKIVKKYWPGPLTLIFPMKADSLPVEVTGGLATASFRMPNHPLTLKLIELAGVPIVGPSANTSGKPSPTTSEHVYHDLQGKIAGIVEGGATKIGVESTVLDLSDVTKAPTILRPGAITQAELAAYLNCEVLVDRHLIKESEAPKSPGMKYKHYSPDTKVLMVRDPDWEAALAWVQTTKQRVGVIAGPAIAEKMRYDVAAVYMYPREDVSSATQGLFAGLRALDTELLNLDVLLVQVFVEEGLGMAYMNRLKKAADQKYFEQ